MTLSDWVVIAVCLAGGYWLMSMFLDRRRPDATPGRPEPGSGESASDRRDRADGSAPDSSPAPWWEILEVSPTATPDEIRQAYRQRMSEYHPDKVATLGPELRELAARKAQQINAAYDEACRAREP